MAKQSPYLLSTGGHMLSKYASRVQKPVKIKELRVSINGWVSQQLIHNVPDISDIIPADLDDYVVDKGFAQAPAGSTIDVARNRILDSLKRSRPLVAEFIPGSNSWRVGSGFNELPAPRGLTELGDNIRNLRKSANGEFTFGLQATYGKDLGKTTFRTVVLSWTATPVDLQAAIDSYVAAGSAKPSSSVLERLVTPIQWFERRLRAAGVPLDLFAYQGVVLGIKTGSGANPTAWSNNGPLYRGCTTLIGPMDVNGHRPVWVGPRLGDVAKWVCDNFATSGSSTGNSSADTEIVKMFSKTYRPGLITTSKTSAELSAVAPSVETYSGSTFGFEYVYEFGPSDMLLGSAMLATDGAVYAAAGSPATTLPFGEVSWSAVATNLEVSSVRYISSGWYIVQPQAVKEWTYTGGSIVCDGSEASGYGVETWTLSPAVFFFRTPMLAVIDHLRQQRSRSDLSAADRTRLDQAIVKAQPYVDGVLSTTVSQRQITPSSTSAVRNLKMVVQAAKGDVDLMKEDLGEGNSLEKMASYLDKARAKQQRFCAFTHVVDEAAVVDDLVSSRVASTVDTAQYWNLSVGVDPISSAAVIMGSYAGATAETLTALEAAVLLMEGASSADGTVTDDVLANQFGLGSGWRADLLSLGSTRLVGDGATRAGWGVGSVNWDKMNPYNFVDVYGFPVTDFDDDDSLIRMQLLFKGVPSDPSGLACSLFFVNQLDFVNA